MVLRKSLSVSGRNEVVAVIAAAALLITGVGMVPLSGNAEDLGVEHGKWGATQVFSSPEFDFFPTCDGSDFGQININVNKAFDKPFSASTGQQVALGKNHIEVSFNGELANPWQLRLFTPDEQELRFSYESNEWLTAVELEVFYLENPTVEPSSTPQVQESENADAEPISVEGVSETSTDVLQAPSEDSDPGNNLEATSIDTTREQVAEPTENPNTEIQASGEVNRDLPTFDELAPFAAEGLLFGASREGFFHIATVEGQTYATYISNNRPVAHEVIYKPDASLNECVDDRAVVDADQMLNWYEANPTPNTQLQDYVFAAATVRLASSKASKTDSTYKVLGNANLRFGHAGRSGDSSQRNSITATGDLSQPFYYNSAAATWFKLTYSTYPLDMAIGTGTGSDHWTGGAVTELNTSLDQEVDYSQWVQTQVVGDEAYGYGVITVTTRFSVNMQTLAVTHKYSLGETASFLKVETTVNNESASTAANMYIWVGTKDDYIRSNDSPVKYRGNLTQAGDFEEVTGATPSEERTAPGSALLITSVPRDNLAGEGVLFYSTTNGTNVVVDGCCSFSNVYNQDPTDDATINDSDAISLDYGFDGSYGLLLAPGNIAAGGSTKITWFYAAGSTGDLADIARSVAAAAAPPAPSVSRTNQTATLTWTAPEVEVGSVITGYRYRYSDDGGTTWVESDVLPATPLSASVSGLVNNSSYVFQVRALTAPEEDQTTVTAGAWSASSVEETLGAPNPPPAPTVVGGNGSLQITYSPATLPSGITNAVTGYDYCLEDCTDETNWFTLSASPATVTGLDNGVSFSVQIRARNINGASLPTEAVSAVTFPAWDNTPSLPAEMQRGVAIVEGVSAQAEVEYSISGGTLPPGLVLDSVSGSITGTPTTGGSYTYTITATNAAGAINATFTSVVSPYWQPSVSAVSGGVGRAISTNLTIESSLGLDFSNGGSIQVSGLPAGVSFTATNVDTPGVMPSINFSGSPTTQGTYQVLVTVTDSDGVESEQIVTFVIGAAVRPGGGQGPFVEPEPTVAPTPLPSETSEPLTPGPSPSLNPEPTPILGPGTIGPVLIPEIEPTPGVVYSDANPIPDFIMDILSKPLAYILGVLSGDPELPELAPSESLSYENGEPVVIELIQTDAENGYILRGDGWEVSLEATDSSGEPLLLDDSGNIILNQDRYVQFSGTGFAPGSVVKVWLFSDPSELSDVIADASGNFVGKAQIPEGIPTGEHTVQLNGLTEDGQLRSVSLGVLIQPEIVIAPAPPVGFDLSGLMNILWIIAAGVVLFFFILWRKRRKKEEEGSPVTSGDSTDLIFASESFAPSQQFPNDSRRSVGPAAPPNRKRFGFKPKDA